MVSGTCKHITVISHKATTTCSAWLNYSTVHSISKNVRHVTSIITDNYFIICPVTAQMGSKPGNPTLCVICSCVQIQIVKACRWSGISISLEQINRLICRMRWGWWKRLPPREAGPSHQQHCFHCCRVSCGGDLFSSSGVRSSWKKKEFLHKLYYRSLVEITLH